MALQRETISAIYPAAPDELVHHQFDRRLYFPAEDEAASLAHVRGANLSSGKSGGETLLLDPSRNLERYEPPRNLRRFGVCLASHEAGECSSVFEFHPLQNVTEGGSPSPLPEGSNGIDKRCNHQVDKVLSIHVLR